MDAQLMGPPGARLQLQPGTTIRGTADTVISDCSLSGGIDDHAPAAASAALFESRFDPALSIRRLTLDNGPIDFFYLSAGEQHPQPTQRLRVAPEHQASTGVAVEAMGESRRVRQAKPQFVEPAFEIGAAARAGMHGDTRGLVDYEDQTIAIKNAVGEPPLTPPLSPQAG